MPKLSALATRLLRILNAEPRLLAGQSIVRIDAGQPRPPRACQSLCLKCDPRTPCVLGSLMD